MYCINVFLAHSIRHIYHAFKDCDLFPHHVDFKFTKRDLEIRQIKVS